MVKRLFADLILSFQDRDASREIIERLSHDSYQKAFMVIEIELGCIYDLLCTKAKAIYSRLGIAARIIGIFVILIVFVVFHTLGERHHQSKIDFIITLVLLGIALVLELWAFRELLISDQTAHWLIKHNKTTFLKVVRALQPRCYEKRRWSNSICQFSLLNFSLGKKPLPYYGIMKMLCIDELLQIQPYDIPESHVDDIRILIFKEIREAIKWAEINSKGTNLKQIWEAIEGAEINIKGTNLKEIWEAIEGAEINSKGTNLKVLYGRRGGRTLERYNRGDLDWSVKLDFDLSILIWHLATEICYFQDFIQLNENDAPANKESGEREPKDERSGKGLMRQRCNYLSQYMLYLLVRRPKMLPIGMGNIKFRDIYAEIGEYIEKQTGKKVRDIDKMTASDKLRKVGSEIMLTVGGRDKSNFVMFKACKLASELGEGEEKWEIIKKFWLEMLGHAASQCRGSHHAQQLRRGGELLTHVWLLMAHFGLTDHFQIPSSHAIAEAIIR
jgi:hypothetical protein|uniref:DUF4220 domain-containing protein n=1 Tax=Fagus sylvatica TaxID=28930 RepID=A0A2N9F672_FAGSY